MVTINNGGTPRDIDLPHLEPDQIDRLVDELVDSQQAPTMPLAVIPLSPTALRPRMRWWSAGVAAAVVGALVLTVTVVADRDEPPPNAASGAPTPVVQAPAPDFGCFVAGIGGPTSVASYLPWVDPAAPGKVGRTADSVCFEGPAGEFVGGQLGASREMVPFFSTSFSPGSTTVAFGLLDPAVTRIEFDPNVPGLPSRTVSQFVAVGDLHAFSLTYDDGGTVRVFVGTRLAVEKPVLPVTFQQLVYTADPATGQPCDPARAVSQTGVSKFSLDTQGIIAQVYPATLDPQNPAPESGRSLCLRILSTTPELSYTAQPIAVTAPLAYLAAMKGAGGTFIWGSLTGSATTMTLTDDAGATTALTPENRDGTRSGWVTFLVFVPDGSPRIISVQPVDADNQPVGPPRAVA